MGRKPSNPQRGRRLEQPHETELNLEPPLPSATASSWLAHSPDGIGANLVDAPVLGAERVMRILGEELGRHGHPRARVPSVTREGGSGVAAGD